MSPCSPVTLLTSTPRTPLVGFFGNGELGMNHLPNYKDPPTPPTPSDKPTTNPRKSR